MLIDLILVDSSKRCIDEAVNKIIVNSELFPKALELCKAEYPISMRAARVVQLFAEKFPDAITPYLSDIVDELLITKVDGVKRSYLKILTFVPSIIALEKSALILNKCIEWLISDKETIAVRAYCIDVLLKFVKQEPVLYHEIKLIFEGLITDEFPSLKVRCIKGLDLIKKYQN